MPEYLNSRFFFCQTKEKSFIQELLEALWSPFRNLFSLVKRNHLAFLFFIILSFLAWLLRALSEEYIASVEYPVHYSNLPPNRILNQPPPEKLLLRVQSDGYTILSTRIRYKRPFTFNVNDFSLYSLSNDTTSVYTLSRYAKDDLMTQLNLSNKNIRIVEIKPDTLIFNFSRVKKKKVPVAVVLADNHDLFAQQFMLNGDAYTDPDSVEVTGPSYIVDTLKYIYTEPVRFKNLSDSAEKRSSLKKISKLIIPVNKVKVYVPVDEFTELQYTVPIHIINVPDSFEIVTFPKNVQVRFLVTLTHYKKVSSDLFKAYIDFEKIDLMMSNETTRLRIELDSLPTYIQKVSLRPRSVEFLIKKTDDNPWSDRGNR